MEAADAEPGDGGALAAADGADAQERARKRPRLSQELRCVCFAEDTCPDLAKCWVHGVLRSYIAVGMQTCAIACSCVKFVCCAVQARGQVSRMPLPFLLQELASVGFMHCVCLIFFHCPSRMLHGHGGGCSCML